ncbi:MAG: YbaB/EbfC family nucleoid-associated protein [Actinobacteria bacterium]|nr:YbaB/EbfC family nucleoid-associated protein [Actinomycetota bacterium]
MSKGKYYPKGQKGQKGGGRSQDMMKQLQQVQQQMSAMQDELAGETVEHSAGGGMVTVVADGQQNIRSVKIDPQVVDPEDVGMLEDLVLAAVVGALEKSNEMASGRMGGLTGGLGLPDF